MEVMHAAEIPCSKLVVREAGVGIVGVESVRAVDRIVRRKTIPRVAARCESVAAGNRAAVCEIVRDGGIAVIDRGMSGQVMAGEGVGGAEMRSADASAAEMRATEASAAEMCATGMNPPEMAAAAEMRSSATAAEMRSSTAAATSRRRSGADREAGYCNRNACHEHDGKLARPVAQHGSLLDLLTWAQAAPSVKPLAIRAVARMTR
ncbi:MAG: hypothetical protein KGL96_06425 [Hyphomicrobiales bacterium]|nr:hypothetical protein [Hyphomicrobiales bacterium]